MGNLGEALDWQDEWSDYTAQVRSQHGDKIAGVWAEPAAGEKVSTKGYIQFVGDIPRGLTPMDGVTFVSGGGISQADHSVRANLAADALVALGYLSFSTGYDPRNRVVSVDVQVAPGEDAVTKAQIIAKLEELLAQEGLTGRAAQVTAGDVRLTVTEGTGPYVVTEHSRGGNWLLDNGDESCTSGWSVNGPNGDGIVTAGHCEGLDQFKQVDEPPYGMTYRTGVHGDDGDVEYHTTDHEERAEFYANSSTIRDVTGKKSKANMVGLTVCRYGRASNTMTCNHEVDLINTATYDSKCPCIVRKLVRANNPSSTGGDSGGPYFRGYTAWGIHHGRTATNTYTYFMSIEEIEDALGLTLKTK